MPHIHLDTVSIHFPIYSAGKPLLKKELVHLATGGLLKKDGNKVIFVDALDNLSITISNGMRLGLIGHNGAGKSTLLRLLGGIYEPTSGEASIQGTVCSILNMMAGFDPEATGYENIIVKCLLHGLTRKQAKEISNEITEFSELGDYIYMPLRTYSSGMQIRLAFAVGTSIASEILLIDEVFGAGDAAFKVKAEERMNNIIASSNILVFTSHDLTLIKRLCNHVLWLDAGKARFFGEVNEGIDKYLSHVHIQPALK